VDAFTQQRVLVLRQEIASLQRDNESFLCQKRHTASEDNTNGLRRFRLFAIKEELLRMTESQSKQVRMPKSDSKKPKAKGDKQQHA